MPEESKISNRNEEGSGWINKISDELIGYSTKENYNLNFQPYSKNLNTNNRACIDDFEFGEKLGSGACGEIHLARVKKDHKMIVAIKAINKKKYGKKINIEKILNEVDVLMMLNHPNIISFFDFFEDKKKYYIITEYSKNGDLYDIMAKKRQFSEKEAAKIIFQIAQGVKKCHDNNIIHCDIKTENIVKIGDKYKLIDFGFSTKCNKNEITKNSLVGTIEYIPPESFYGSYSLSNDIWAIGVLIYELITMETPFFDEEDQIMKDNIKFLDYKMPNYFSNNLKNLLESIFCPRNERINIDQLLQSSWFK